MSFYRQSPGKRSPYHRSPPRLLASEREFLQQEIQIKNAFRSQSQNRRLLDEIALLQIKLRKTQELEIKIEGLLKQNGLLAQENEHLARELSERRYELERFRANSAQLQERDSIKTAQLTEINRSLELQIDLLKKERLESNKLYEAHIQKLQFMLEDKIKELDSLSLKCNDLLNQKQISEIRFEEERNKLKNLMVRTSHDMERELEYTKEKQTTEKFVEIETLKKNYTNQILILEDEINKLKAANAYKVSQFESQLNENKNIRNRYDEEIRKLQAENNGLREKILKLEEINRSEVVNIEVKYNDLQKKGETNLKHGHDQEIRTLLTEIERINLFLKDKNNQIQNLMREKREHKIQEEERELALRAQIDTLKNKLNVQSDKSTAENHELNDRINKLSGKLLRESESYHERANNFRKNIDSLESELKSKQNELDNTRSENELKSRELQRNLEDLTTTLEKTRRLLSDSESERSKENRQAKEYREASEKEALRLNKKVKQLEINLEETSQKAKRQSQNSGDAERLLRIEIQSLTKTVAILQAKLSEEQRRHSKEMADLSENLRAKLDKLIHTQKKTLTEIEESRANELQALNRRIEKLQRQKSEMESKLAEYVKMYESLNKYFASPHEGALFSQKSENNVYQVLRSSLKSSIHIF